MKSYNEVCTEVIEEIQQVLTKINNSDVDKFILNIYKSEKIFFVGVGRVLLSLKSMAKRFKHLGYNTHIVGDINEPPISSEDLLIVASGSGESVIPLEITKKAKKYDAKILLITSSENNSIGKLADDIIKLNCPNKREGYSNVKSIQPMSTLFEQSIYIFGDIISLRIMEKNNMDISTIIDNHANLE